MGGLRNIPGELTRASPWRKLHALTVSRDDRWRPEMFPGSCMATKADVAMAPSGVR